MLVLPNHVDFQIVNDDEEEWPSIAGSSASQSPTRVPVSAVITGKEQSPSFQKRGSIVPVGDERPFSSGGIIQVNHSALAHKEELVSRSKVQGQDASLKGSIRFLTDEWDVSPIPEEVRILIILYFYRAYACEK